MTVRLAVAAGLAAVVVAIAVLGAIVGGDGGTPSSVQPFVEPVSERVEKEGPHGQHSGSNRTESGASFLARAPRGSEQPEPEGLAAPGRLVVRFRPGVPDAAKERVRSLIDGTLLRPLPLDRAEVIALPAGTSVAAARARVAVRPEVQYAEPDFIYRASSVVPSDPRFSALWGLHNGVDTDIDAPEAWAGSTGSRGVRVGIVDTGVAYDHPDLAPNVWVNAGEHPGNGVDDDGNGYVDDVRGWDWVGRDNDPLDLHGHGTHVAGTVAAKGDNSLAVTGVAWDAALVPLRVLDANGSGMSSSIASAFSYAGKLGVDIVNASLGGPSFSQTVLDSIRSSPGTLFVVAAGNEGADNDSAPSYPCNYEVPNVVCVAATTQTDALAGFSNYGATTVDLGAPGSGILSTLPKTETRLRDDFESVLAERWTVGGNVGWGSFSDTYGNYLADSPGASYLPAADAWVALNDRVDLSAAQGCRLRYALRLDTEKSRDFLIAEASTDGGTWSRLGVASGSTSGRWTSMSHDLSSFDGGAAYVRFRLTSDDNTTVGGGADIDDVEVRCIGTSYTGSELGTFSGTSMAAPHVAGAAAVLKSADPALDATSLKSALTGGAFAIPALDGRTVSGGRLNLARSLGLVVPLPLDGGSTEPVATPAPSPEPSFTQSEELATPTPTPAPSPSGDVPPVASPSLDATPTPVPSPSPSKGAPTRAIAVELARHLVVRGTVSSSDAACDSGATVVVRRNGVRVASTRTDAAGRFRVRPADRVGRYAAIAVGTSTCPRAVARARHRHPSGVSGQSDDAQNQITTTASTCWTFTRPERLFGRLVAQARDEAGLDRLRVDPELSRVASLHASEMQSSGAVFHTPPATLQGRVTQWDELGENIGLGTRLVSLHRSFMVSAAHRDNILHDDFVNIGIGVVKEDARVWVTLLFQRGGDPGTTLVMPSC